MLRPKRGEIWLVRFPFTDLVSTKLRPALVWATHGEDIIVLGIFSQIPAGTLRKTWVLITEQHPIFSRSGLKKTSLVKAEKIAVVHESIFQKKLGVLPATFLAQVQEALKKALLLS
ncbi:MAG TPA: type II toxin-antitoxin system PemK/MazF family toxin [Anaerolineae bacterium]|nr:type II toxin-antitoxin system PemK/MazF family toxin [Anaerolineae bacterium]HQI83605.1 type II toxin-antitoxin system PemK/MazF family toxin [Anaerolineae bacterium]